ncbi:MULTISPECIES: porin [unclassified Caballeronia]|uniref:porin n=1 Tax=unclassified Caballeronia TaxID=2646786 RepID=UPI002028B6CB|nr:MULTISPECIES: porin [unclassified Caballeronia]
MERKHVVTLGILLASGAAASNALAQGSVTLYGIIDTGIAYVHNVAGAADKTRNENAVAATNGALSGNRWGLRGREDLGGGLAAVFALENGFKASTGALGQGGRLFGRQSYVGLSDARWGTLTLGRQYDPLKDLIQPLTADGTWGTVNVTPGDLDNYDNSLRVSNAIKYVSPVFSNVQIEALYGLGGVAGNVTAGHTMAVAATWRYAGFAFAGGYFYARYDPANAAGNSADIISISLASSGYSAAASALQIARVATTYDVSGFTVGAGYSNTQYKPAFTSATAFNQAESFNSASAFVNYKFTPAVIAGLSYSYTNSRGAQAAHYNQLSGGAEYLLSTRTALYTLIGYQRASGTTLSGKAAVPATASVGDTGFQSASGSQFVSYAGIRHRF